MVNGSAEKWAVKKVGGLSLKTASRRFDIEFRTQYFYRYNAGTQAYDEVAVEVPMLFVQEEYLDTLTDDVRSVNPAVTLTVTMNTTDLTRIESDYDTLIDVFITNKSTATSSDVVAAIGEKISFAQ